MADLDLDDATLGQMLRILAHDLRNPLAVIISNLGYLRSVLSAAEQEVLETLIDTVTSCDDLKHVINNIELLGTTLKGAGEEPTAPLATQGSFELLPSAQEVIVQCEPLASSHGVAFSHRLGPAQGAWASGSAAMFERALSNLVRNAIRHTPSGSEVLVEATADRDGFRVCVLDSGQPIDFPRAFSPEGQIEAKASGFGRYGRGLGLLMARVSADAIGAQIGLCTPRSGFTSGVQLTLDRASQHKSSHGSLL